MKNLKGKLPPVTSLVAFEAAARLNSFAAASHELNVSREAVSRQMRMLEEYLGVLLFERDANSATLGPIGEQFLRVVSPNLWAIANAATKIGGAPDGEGGMGSVAESVDLIDAPNLLILDDTLDNIHQLTAILSGEFRISAFKEVSPALEHLSKSQVDLVLLDIRMPEMSGIDVARQIRSTAALEDVPIIFVTNLDTTEDEVAGLEAGGSDFITRPIVPAILKARVRTHIELAQSRKAIEQLLKRRMNRLAEAEDLIAALSAQIEKFQSG